MISPSCHRSRDPAGMDPGDIPPTSEWCARVTANATISPFTSTGLTSVMSGRCVPPAYGSLRIHTSPGTGPRAMTAATDSGIAPRCTGMCSACATIRPDASNSAAEQSLRSLMFEEYALRTSTVPISSAIPARALRSTDSVIGSIPSARSVIVPPPCAPSSRGSARACPRGRRRPPTLA